MTLCSVCHKDLTDPKNRGDPFMGEWVCDDTSCRSVHWAAETEDGAEENE